MKLNSTIITGVIYKICNQERYGDFIKRAFWIQELNAKYPQTWQLEMWHDDISILNTFKELDMVQCEATVKGKLLEKKGGGEFVIVSIKCEKIVHI